MHRSNTIGQCVSQASLNFFNEIGSCIEDIKVSTVTAHMSKISKQNSRISVRKQNCTNTQSFYYKQQAEAHILDITVYINSKDKTLYY